MAEPGPRVAGWLDVANDLIGQPLTTVPHQAVIDHLCRIFSCTTVSYNWSDADGSAGILIEPGLLDQLPETATLWATGALDGCHPLIEWFAATGDPRPQTSNRVPTALVSRRRRSRMERPLATVGLDRQLGINYRLGGRTYRTFAIGRGQRSFDDEDLLVAGYVHRTLVSLDRQARLVARLTGSSDPVLGGPSLGLTGRELAVLQLVADGYWVRPISQLLGCSPRTVEKHLQNIYRKLGVRDRLNAVIAAQLAGLLPSRTDRARRIDQGESSAHR